MRPSPNFDKVFKFCESVLFDDNYDIDSKFSGKLWFADLFMKA